MSRDTGGPAFPIAITGAGGFKTVDEFDRAVAGMTLRDYFAAHCPMEIDERRSWETEAEVRYKYADAMLAERSKP